MRLPRRLAVLALAALSAAVPPACSDAPGNLLAGDDCLDLLADQGVNPFTLDRAAIELEPNLSAVSWFCEYFGDGTDEACAYDDAAIIALTDEAGVLYFAHFANTPIAPVGDVFCRLPGGGA